MDTAMPSQTSEPPSATRYSTTPGSESGATAKPSGGIAYQPALDGLRGLALLAIAVYHSGVGWAPGAFLSVSTFFTLSGFLITALLIREQETTGGISLRGFWTRRLRRLMPAALAAVALITLASILLADAAQLDRLRGDALSSLGYVANWHFILAGDSYEAIFSSPSPFTHFWTLAIEEQFYVLFPPLVALLLVGGQRNRRRLAAIAFGVLTVVSVIWSNVLLSGGSRLDRLYFGTDTRLPELLAGGLLALWWTGRPAAKGSARSRIRGSSSLALVAVLVLWLVADREDHFWYRGGLIVYSLLTLAVILGAVERHGLVRRVLANRPLVWVGTVSYAAYLIHWPVLVWLRQHTAMPAWQRLVLGMALSLVAAEASRRWIERPVRTSSWDSRTTVRLAGIGAGVVAALVLIVSATATAPGPTIDFEAAAARQAEIADSVAARNQVETAAAAGALRVATFGDSTAFMTGTGLAEWGFAHPQQWLPSNGVAGIGCGLLTNVTRRTKGEVLTEPTECAGWSEQWATDADKYQPQVAVVQFGPWEVVDQQLDRQGPFRAIGSDAELDSRVRAALENAVEVLRERSDLILLVLPPNIDVGRSNGRSPSDPFPESDPARMERFRSMLLEVDARFDDVGVVDLAGWLAQRSDDGVLRPDGVHFTEATSSTVADWLAPEILRLAGRPRS